MQLDSDIPIAEQYNSPSQEQCSGSILEPESLTVEQPESFTEDLPESLSMKHESLTEEQPKNLPKESETVFILNLVSLSSPHSLSVSSLTDWLEEHPGSSISKRYIIHSEPVLHGHRVSVPHYSADME